MTTVTSVLPYFISTFIFLLISKLVVSHIDFYYGITHNDNKSRYESLDGLRGFLSISVFFHHSVVSYYYFKFGTWDVPPSAFYTLLGQSSVCFFFMITGFLFWSKAISKGGKFNIKALYISRFFRIFPLYIFSVFFILGIILLISRFTIKTDLLNLSMQVFRWLTCLGSPDVNGFEASLINAKVAWTLRYEGLFYLALPFIAIFAKPKRFIFLFTALVLLHVINPNSAALIKIINFLFGMAAAHIVNHFNFKKICSRQWFSIIPILTLTSMSFLFTSSYNMLAYILIFIAFLSFLYGNNLFGLLIAPASKYLGTISYSIYLLHGIVLFVVLHIIDKFYPIKLLNPINYWLVIGFCGLIVILLSGVTYRFVEHPFIRPLAKVSQEAK